MIQNESNGGDPAMDLNQVEGYKKASSDGVQAKETFLVKHTLFL